MQLDQRLLWRDLHVRLHILLRLNVLVDSCCLLQQLAHRQLVVVLLKDAARYDRV